MSHASWFLLAGLTDHDVYEQRPIYLREHVSGEPPHEDDGQSPPLWREVLWRFEDVRDHQALRNPKPITDYNVADAAGHLGFEYFCTEPFRRGAVWIIEEREEDPSLL